MRRGHRAAERVPGVWPGPGLGQDQPPGPAAGLHHGHVRLKWDGHTVQVQAGLYVVLLAVDDKLHWTFKLYDVDGNGEIDIFEMEKMFVSLCSIVESSENDQLKRNRNSASKCSIRRFIIITAY